MQVQFLSIIFVKAKESSAFYYPAIFTNIVKLLTATVLRLSEVAGSCGVPIGRGNKCIWW